ncbi:MAG: glycosyltransferase family 39 protein, partial [Candidatus Margulisbacteria bacterium]|nr:glycosyltransferase family 39 protein [Candidatus Margulisiibacteriota bacterium]
MALLKKKIIKFKVNAWSLFWLALGLRLLFYILFHHLQEIAYNSRWFAAEMSAIATSLTKGTGYASAIAENYPTAHIEPLYPLIMALIFKIFGICTNLSGIIMTLINIFISAATVSLLYIFSRKLFSEKVAQYTGLILCFWPNSLWRNFNLWSEVLAAFLFLLSLYLILLWQEKPTLKNSISLGILLALCVLTTATLVPLLGLFMLAVLFFKNKYFKYWLVTIFIALIIFTPWPIRNYFVFHKFIPLRSTSAIELYSGNVRTLDGTTRNSSGHPFNFLAENKQYQQYGEIKYNSLKSREFITWLKINPQKFIKLTLWRIYWFWFGDPLKDYGLLKKLLHILPT